MTEEDDIRTVDRRKYEEFLQWELEQEKKAKQEEEKPKVAEKKKHWTCQSCGYRLAAAETPISELRRRFTDGCPGCGGTTVDVE